MCCCCSSCKADKAAFCCVCYLVLVYKNLTWSFPKLASCNLGALFSLAWVPAEHPLLLTPLPCSAPLLISSSFSIAALSGGVQVTKFLLLRSNYLVPRLPIKSVIVFIFFSFPQNLNMFLVRWSVPGVALALCCTKDLDPLTCGLAAGSFDKFPICPRAAPQRDKIVHFRRIQINDAWSWFSAFSPTNTAKKALVV